MPEATAADELFDAVAAAPIPRRPASTYRVQLHQRFTFDDATAVVDYLHALGITDLYCSPYLLARPGSTHGYDVFDHGKLNPEIGDEVSHARLVAKLREHAMGRVLDIVPNHMGIGDHNPYWVETLEVGRSSPSSRFFDIDWEPVKGELAGRVLLPILEGQYGEVLEAGKLQVARDGGRFEVLYHETRLPLAPQSYALILGRRIGALLEAHDADDPHIREYRSLYASAEFLPARGALDPVQIERVLLEKEVIKVRLERLCRERPDLAAFIDANVASLRGTEGDPRSFDDLHKLLEQQVYRLAYWRVAAEEINYRRFFDINTLAGLRTEDPLVFDVAHTLIFRMVDDGGVTGLRVDHPDGLADPAGYFERLQSRLFIRECAAKLAAEGRADEWPVLERRVAERWAAVAAVPASDLARRVPVVAEKILSRGEELPEDWPIDGTVGYEYLNVLNGLFVDPSSAESIEQTYSEFTGDRQPFPEVLYEAKLLILRASMASEVNVLARQLNRVSEADRRYRDFTLNELGNVLREVIACFPVYRTYMLPGRPTSQRDRESVEQAVARARRRNPTIDASLFAFVQSALLDVPADAPTADRVGREVFVRRFQQTTGPIQAKGLEDTAFYRQFKLGSLNEVGADPLKFGGTTSAFHALNAQRLARWPGSLGTTATHDTKRGEDARVRLDALSEFPDEWRTHLARWQRSNARRKTLVGDADAPDPREEYLFYQTLVATWPIDAEGEAAPGGYVARIQEYMLKAAREAKRNTSWTDPDPSYGETLLKFVADALEGPDAGPFLRDLVPFTRKLSRVGVVHSLSQTLLKVASPGVPDVYQGCELWDESLVDPDNRRPVDYPRRAALLRWTAARIGGGETRREVASSLLAAPEDAAIKQYVLSTALVHRREDQDLYERGTYKPVEADGEAKGRVVGFLRQRDGRSVLAVASRLVGSLMGEDAAAWPTGPAWGDATLALGDGGPARWRDLLTGEVVEGGGLRLADLLGTLPVALLVGEPG